MAVVMIDDAPSYMGHHAIKDNTSTWYVQTPHLATPCSYPKPLHYMAALAGLLVAAENLLQ